MFVPHLSCISLKRKEPVSISSKIINKIISRNENLVVKIVMSSWINGDFKKTDIAIKKKIKKENEFYEKSKIAASFLDIWNEWRKFYFNLSPVRIKTKGQITQIENSIKLAEENDIKLTLFIACTYKAFVWRKVNPGFHNLINSGLENYEKHIDDVIVDIDRFERDLSSNV